MLPIALTIAGSDPSGGAGLQADLKTFHQFGAYGMAVVTLITVQNTVGVTRVEVLPPDLVGDQLRAVCADLPPHAIKTGALGSVGIIAQISQFPFGDTPLVVDPVMISKHGAALLDAEAQATLRELLVPRATLVTPNLQEAEALTGKPVSTVGEMRRAAEELQRLGCANVLLKGGHLAGPPLDLLLTADGKLHELLGERIDTPHTHGTGCTYAAAITAGLAHGLDLLTAVTRAKQFITAAIRTNPGLGHGQGPVNHFAGTGSGFRTVN